MKSSLTDLLPDQELPPSIVNALYLYDQKGCDALFAALAVDNSALEINQYLYAAVRDYLALKLFDHLPLTKDEAKLVSYFPELDEDRIVRVQITDELIKKAIDHPTALSPDELKSLDIVLTDSFLDVDELTSNMINAYRSIKQLESYESNLLAEKEEDLLRLEYGYDIFDLNAIKKRIAQSQTSNYPLTQRERIIIERYHQINPELGF